MKSSVLLSTITTLLIAVSLAFANKYFTGDGIISIISIFLGFDTASGFAIKMVIYGIFIFSWLEIIRIKAKYKQEENMLNTEILDGKAVNADSLQILINRAEHLQRKTPRLLLSLIANAGHVLINSKMTISEGLHLVDSQMALYHKDQKSELAVIGNLAATMIGLGLMGSLIGISASLSNFGVLLENSTDNTDNIKTIFSYFATAWNTTLLGFLFSIIMQYLLHNLNRFQTTASNRIEQYLIDNLFSRLRSNE